MENKKDAKKKDSKDESIVNNRINSIDEKIKQLKNQRQVLLQKEREKERKTRTRRLIQIGAISEKYFNCQDISPEIYDKKLKNFIENHGTQFFK